MIKTTTFNDNGETFAILKDETRELTLLLAQGESTAVGLTRHAEELRRDAMRLTARAAFIEAAIRHHRAERAAVLEKESKQRERNAQAKARRLAAKHGIELERDGDHIWVSCPTYWGDDAETDPLEGNHMALPGVECLQAVETYVTAIEELAS